MNAEKTIARTRIVFLFICSFHPRKLKILLQRPRINGSVVIVFPMLCFPSLVLPDKEGDGRSHHQRKHQRAILRRVENDPAESELQEQQNSDKRQEVSRIIPMITNKLISVP